MRGPIALGAVVCVRSLPNDLVLEAFFVPEYGVEKNLEVVAGRRITVQIQRPSGLQDLVQLQQSDRHVREVGHERAPPPLGAQKAMKRFEDCRDRLPSPNHLVIRRRCRLIPYPRIQKCSVLSFRFEESVVVSAALKRRIQVDEIDALIIDVEAEHVEVVAVVQHVAYYRPGAATSRSPRTPSLRHVGDCRLFRSCPQKTRLPHWRRGGSRSPIGPMIRSPPPPLQNRQIEFSGSRPNCRVAGLSRAKPATVMRV